MTNETNQSVEDISLSKLADSLINASKIAKELGIDISRNGIWRKVIISNTLGHKLSNNPDDPLLDATKDGVDYAYLAAHYGKRAQMWLSKKSSIKKLSVRKKHTFIIAFFLIMILPKSYQYGVVRPVLFGKKQADKQLEKHLSPRPKITCFIFQKHGSEQKMAKGQN